MSINYIFGLLGGLALFLYGMELMSKGLELVAGDRLRVIIEKMTSNFFKAVIVGSVVTAIIQSSSATTVMVVGFVNAGIMSLYQAVGIIMGANIGTTITGQLVALNISTLAPLIAFIGFVLFTFSQKKSKQYLGQVIIGLGFLFMGMEFMSTSMEPLREYPGFINLMTSFSNPLLGVLVGAIFTAIIQSSSASLGILQAIANQGLIPLSSSMFIVCGFNIGTCITSVLSAIGSSKNAQRTAAVHVLFNLIGTVIFIILTFFLPIEAFIIKITRNNPAAQIANLHTLFNIGTTILLCGFSKKLVDLSHKIIRGEDKEYEALSLQYINASVKKDASTMFTDIRAEVNRMHRIAEENSIDSINLIYEYSDEKYDKIYQKEEVINFLNKEITKYILTGLGSEMDKKTSDNFAGYLRITRDLERIGDHSKNIADSAKFKNEHNLDFTEDSKAEIEKIKEELFKMYNLGFSNFEYDKRRKEMKTNLFYVEDLLEEYRNRHMDRMKDGLCDPESGLLYEKMMTAFERIASYISNVDKLTI